MSGEIHVHELHEVPKDATVTVFKGTRGCRVSENRIPTGVDLPLKAGLYIVVD